MYINFCVFKYNVLIFDHKYKWLRGLSPLNLDFFDSLTYSCFWLKYLIYKLQFIVKLKITSKTVTIAAFMNIDLPRSVSASRHADPVRSGP